MVRELALGLSRNFLGSAPRWYKVTIVAFLAVNPLVAFTAGPFVAGWLLVAEFIFTLAMALKCYPIQPGGLLALEAIVLGMTSPESARTCATITARASSPVPATRSPSTTSPPDRAWPSRS